jgi:uncharacterized membrane protein
MELMRSLSLIGAAATLGLIAGVFGLYANTIMPGLRSTDDRTFVGAFQSIDRAIINPLFMAVFFGPLILTGLAAALHLGRDARLLLPWIGAAFVLYLLCVAITIAINVPLNDGLKAAGTPDAIGDLAAVRARFDEAKWVRWNVVRTLLSTTSFACLLWALVLHGRAAPSLPP